MREPRSSLHILTAHFFRRFFDNDTVQPDGDTQTTVVRALAMVAAPGLLVSYIMALHYPWMPLWPQVITHAYFVTFSFVAVGSVAVFEWEMLFPDKLDFLVLTPMPIRATTLFAAKVAALAAFVGLFVFAANVFPAILLPHHRLLPIWPQVFAHIASTAAAGVFAALWFLAIGCAMTCVLSGRMFRLASLFLQAMATSMLLLMFLANLRFGGLLPVLLQHHLTAARWLPPIWFVGLYERLLYGSKAPPFSALMARYALLGFVTVTGTVLVAYPCAWARVQRMAIEGVTRSKGSPSMSLQRAIAVVVLRPGGRGVFHFIGQTLARNTRYHAYVAIYCGTGLALALNSSIALTQTGNTLRAATSTYGLHALMPMLIFWTAAGLRTAFAFPVNLEAGWIFRVSGADFKDCAAAARTWAMVCSFGVVLVILAALMAAGWHTREVLVQAVCGMCLCLLLCDGFFYAPRALPFNQPRMPGKVSFPIMLTLYIGVYPQFVIGMVWLTSWLEKHPAKLVPLGFAVVLLHGLVVALRASSSEEDLAEYEGEVQLLGLMTQ